MLTVVLAWPASAAEPVLVARARTLWVAEPVALDENVDDQALADAHDALVKALVNAGAEVRQGREAVLASAAEGGNASSRLDRARGMLTSGEERYMAFEYGPAAASLAEASGLFTVALAELPPEDLDRLYRARLLEGLAWLEAGQPDAAREAFRKLATIRPDYEPDPALMPPHARTLYQQAVGEVMAKGTAALDVKSDPPGAQVFLDGIARGATPVTLGGIPVGTHGVKVELLGYQTVREEVTLAVGETEARQVSLLPTPPKLSLDRLHAGARRGEGWFALEQDLALLAKTADVEGVVVVGVASRGEGLPPLVAARLWTAVGPSAAVAKAGEGGVRAAAQRLAAPLLSSSWPAAQMHEDGVPLDTDFTRALLGVSDGFGRTDVVADDGGALLWIGAGVGAAALLAGVAAAIVVTVIVLNGGNEPPPARKTHVDLVF